MKSSTRRLTHIIIVEEGKSDSVHELLQNGRLKDPLRRARKPTPRIPIPYTALNQQDKARVPPPAASTFDMEPQFPSRDEGSWSWDLDPTIADEWDVSIASQYHDNKFAQAYFTVFPGDDAITDLDFPRLTPWQVAAPVDHAFSGQYL
jgi:hypothetical protein